MAAIDAHFARADVVEIDDFVAFFIILIRHVQEVIQGEGGRLS